jgi:TetR/AcrR family transcriptional repressor of nem operon
MKNKRTPVQSSNRKHVIEVAAQMFLSGGYVYTSMDDVMRESQVSKSNIYYHFKSKEDLLLSVVEYWITLYEAVLFALLSQNERKAEERIISFLDSLTQGIAQRDCQGACPFISLYLQSPGNADQVKSKISRFIVELQMMIEKLFRQGIQEREFRENVEPEKAACLFIALIEGSLVLAETNRDVSIIKKNAQFFCEMLH